MKHFKTLEGDILFKTLIATIIWTLALLMLDLPSITLVIQHTK